MSFSIKENLEIFVILKKQNNKNFIKNEHKICIKKGLSCFFEKKRHLALFYLVNLIKNDTILV